MICLRSGQNSGGKLEDEHLFHKKEWMIFAKEAKVAKHEITDSTTEGTLQATMPDKHHSSHLAGVPHTFRLLES